MANLIAESPDARTATWQLMSYDHVDSHPPVVHGLLTPVSLSEVVAAAGTGEPDLLRHI